MLSEQINTIKIPIGNASIMFLPLLYALVIGLALYLLQPVKWINQESSEEANIFVTIGISLFLAKISQERRCYSYDCEERLRFTAGSSGAWQFRYDFYCPANCFAVGISA